MRRQRQYSSCSETHSNSSFHSKTRKSLLLDAPELYISPDSAEIKACLGFPDDDQFTSQNTDVTLRQKTKVVMARALPSILCNLLMMMQEMVNLIFLGHLN